ncbi:N-acetylmuramoyl-L-alanine amidase [Paenibacillus sp. L3-i20]|uniref:N-acetylmuramoyl-L-alanine amidase n=1 Tax=Paenibacillus sp. L3-i20 TaxID=2905833 RepID=UPI001EE1011D|nr:N-acetylmuramoyl-L-alanine amidase [Paenibacillus sp. L3-i20]GKU75643.1 hypothetical protein L3i20_v200400 [Paenibacillus sp. L3-i20]
MTNQYKINHIPRSTPCNRRPGIVMKAETLTIHNTGNPKSNAANERAWLTNPSNARTASYHIVVDEHEAIECLPLSEVGWHAGDGHGPGNRKSIGIEICESGNYAKTVERAIELIASMLKERGWGVDRLRRHYDWSGKLCPRLMYDEGKWTSWEMFINQVREKLQLKPKPSNDEIKIVVNGKMLDQKGTLKNGVTSVPIRVLAEAFGAEVTWNGDQRTVHIKN